jgi:SnoaL-like domain
MATDHAELYRRWLSGLWTGELEVADEIVAEDFVGHWPDREVEGRDGLVDLIRETRGQVAELAFELDVGPLIDGDLVAARWSGEGRAGDQRMRFLGHDLLLVRDGRFAEYWVVSWASA